MDDKINELFVDLVRLLKEARRASVSPVTDKKIFKSKISSKVVQLRMQKSKIPSQVSIDDFIKQCERVALTLAIADIDRALAQWQAINSALKIVPEEQASNKSGLEVICDKYKIDFTKESKDESVQKNEEKKELERVKEKYHI